MNGNECVCAVWRILKTGSGVAKEYIEQRDGGYFIKGSLRFTGLRGSIRS